MNVEIIPAVMPYSYPDLVKKIEMAAPYVELVQIDLMDGHFVPSESWPYAPHEGELAHYYAMVAGSEELPHADKLSFGMDLMIERPMKEVENWIRAGAKRLIIHWRSFDTEKFDHLLELKVKYDIEIGFALQTTDPVKNIKPFMYNLDFVQCMGIANPGYQGEPFDERVLERISDIQKISSNIPIQIDGSVNFDTAKKLADVGAQRLVVGSALYAADNFAQALKELQRLVN